jgi:hypothetical protein
MRSTFFHITYINSVRTSREAQYISLCNQEHWPLDRRSAHGYRNTVLLPETSLDMLVAVIWCILLPFWRQILIFRVSAMHWSYKVWSAVINAAPDMPQRHEVAGKFLGNLSLLSAKLNSIHLMAQPQATGWTKPCLALGPNVYRCGVSGWSVKFITRTSDET